MLAFCVVILCHSALCPPPLDFRSILCHTTYMPETLTTSSQARFNRSHLIDALVHEYEFLCHDDFNADTDFTPAEYRAYLDSEPDSTLIDEVYVSCFDDQQQAIDEFIDQWL